MADTNNNPAAGSTGGPSVSSTGPNTVRDAPKSKGGSDGAPKGATVPEENAPSGPKGVPSGE